MQEKAYRGVAMEGRVAHWYDARARKELDEYQAVARRMAERLPAGSTVLEVAPGPGLFAIELAKLGQYKITALDISETFVRSHARTQLGKPSRLIFVTEMRRTCPSKEGPSISYFAAPHSRTSANP